MRHIPYGYRIENGKAVIDEEAAGKVKTLYVAYLSGASFQAAADESGIKVQHCGAKRILSNRHYLGDDFYPPIIDQEPFDKAESEKQRRAEALGRLNRKKEKTAPQIPTIFRFQRLEKHFDDPKLQAEYLYSLIESEVV